MSQNYNEKHTETVARERATKTMKEFQKGNLPENKELLEGVDLIEEKLREVNPKLSHTGQKASKDVQNILENTREIIEKKNEDEHLQKAYKHAQAAGQGRTYQQRISQLRSMLAGVNAKELTNEARGNIQSLFMIVKLAFLSPEFRSTTNEFFSFFGDVISRQSERGQERLQKGKPEGEEFREKSKKEPALETPEGYPEPKHGYEWVERGGSYSLQRTLKKERSHPGLSQEQEEKLVDRMVDLLQTFHKYPEYSNSITYISQSIKKLSHTLAEGKRTMDTAARADSKRQHTSDIQHHQLRSKEEMLMFIENWIGEDYSFDSFTDSMLKFKHIVENDTELKGLFRDLRTFFTKSARDSSYVNQRELVRNDCRDLIYRTRFFLFDKYRDEFRTLKKEILFLNRSIQHDETAEKLRGNVKQLISHLLMDSSGNPTLKPELLSDAQILLQVVFKTLKYIPLPPIRKETPNGGSFELDNLVISCTDILPSQIHLGATMDAEKVDSNVLHLTLSKVRAHIRNAKFAIDKRDGFPKFKESGFIDVDMRGKNGLTVDLELQPERVSLDENKTVESLFRVKSASCVISKLNLRFRDTGHDGLYKFLGPVINLMARKRIETLVRDQIVDTVKQINTTSAKAATEALRKGGQAKERAAKLPSAAKKSKKKAKKSHETKSTGKPSSQKTSHQHPSSGQRHHGAGGMVDTTPITSAGAGVGTSSSSQQKQQQRGVVDTTPITSAGGGKSTSPTKRGVDTTPFTSGGQVSSSTHKGVDTSSVAPGGEFKREQSLPTSGQKGGMVDTTPITSTAGGKSSKKGVVDTTPITSTGAGGKSSSSQRGVVDTTPITSTSAGGVGKTTSSPRGVVDTTPITSGGGPSSSSPQKGSQKTPTFSGEQSRAPSSYQGGYVDSSVVYPSEGSSQKRMTDPTPPISSGMQQLDPQTSYSPQGHGDPLMASSSPRDPLMPSSGMPSSGLSSSPRGHGDPLMPHSSKMSEKPSGSPLDPKPSPGPGPSPSY